MSGRSDQSATVRPAMDRARDLLDRAAARVEGGYATSELSLGATRQLVDVARGYLWLAQLEASQRGAAERARLALTHGDLVSQGIVDRPRWVAAENERDAG